MSTTGRKSSAIRKGRRAKAKSAKAKSAKAKSAKAKSAKGKSAKAKSAKGRKPLTLEEKQEAARRHAALKEIAKRAAMGFAEAATHLLAMERNRLYTEFGSASLGHYASKYLGYSGGQTRDLVALEKRLEKLPRIAAEFRAGNLEWTKAREAAKGAEATREDPARGEDHWLALAKTLSSVELERARARATGEPVVCRRSVELTETDMAELEGAVDLLRRELGRALTFSEAILELARRARAGGGNRGGKPTDLLVRSVCVACDASHMRSSRGVIELTPEALGRAACTSYHYDLTDEHRKLERKIPRKVLRDVRARDNDGCIFPGCPNKGFLEAHHEGGWREVGHDPTKVYLLCTSHHLDRHAGRILAALDGTLLQFALSSGECLGGPIELDVATRKKNAEARARRSHERACAVEPGLELVGTATPVGWP